MKRVIIVAETRPVNLERDIHSFSLPRELGGKIITRGVEIHMYV